MSIIDAYPLQLYFSVSIFAPKDSLVANAFGNDIPPMLSLLPRRETGWDDSQQIFEGHQDAVTNAEASPDSTLLVSSSEDCTVRIWRVKDGKCLYKFVGHKDCVFSAAFFPGGEIVASGSLDRTVKLWSIKDGKCLRTLRGHNSAVHHLAISPNSSCLAFASHIDAESGSGKIWLWSIINKKYTQELQGHWGGVNSVAFSPDSKLLVTGTEDGFIRVWDIQDTKCLYTLQRHESPVYSALFAPNSSYIASSSFDGTTRIWDFTTEMCTQTFESDTTITIVSISPDSKLVATASSTYEIQIWNVDTGSCDYHLNGHVESISSVAFSPDSQLLVSASADFTVRTWKLSGRSALKSKNKHGAVNVVELSPDCSVLASGDTDGLINLLSMSDGRRISALQAGDHSFMLFTAPTFSNDGQYLLSLEFSGEAWLWSVRDGKCIHDFSGYDWGIKAASFSRDSKVLILGCGDGVLRRWEIGMRFLDDLMGHEAAIYVVTTSSYSELVASGDRSGVVRIWNMRMDTCLHELKGHEDEVVAAVFSPDSAQLATSSLDNIVRLWNVGDGSCIRILHQKETANSVAFSPDLRFLATANSNDTVQIWRIKDGESLLTYKFPRVGSCVIKFDPSGTKLIFDAGVLSLEDMVSVDSNPSFAYECIADGLAITQDTQWVTWRGEKIIWLPVSVRPKCWVIHGSTIAIGCMSGRAVIMRLDCIEK
jgi:WD40 repeat protein